MRQRQVHPSRRVCARSSQWRLTPARAERNRRRFPAVRAALGWRVVAASNKRVCWWSSNNEDDRCRYSQKVARDVFRRRHTSKQGPPCFWLWLFRAANHRHVPKFGPSLAKLHHSALSNLEATELHVAHHDSRVQLRSRTKRSTVPTIHNHRLAETSTWERPQEFHGHNTACLAPSVELLGVSRPSHHGGHT